MVYGPIAVVPWSAGQTRAPGRAALQSASVLVEFSGEIIYWRGPSPFHFVTVPEEQSAAIESVSSLVTYGWGAIPVKARLGNTDFKTSLFPKGDLYLVPLKDAVRKAEGVVLGDTVAIRLQLDA
jgi:Domain of unknown function (DUF1905)